MFILACWRSPTYLPYTSALDQTAVPADCQPRYLFYTRAWQELDKVDTRVDETATLWLGVVMQISLSHVNEEKRSCPLTRKKS